MLIKNPASVIEAFSSSMDSTSLASKERYNALMTDFQYLVIQKYENPVGWNDSDYLLMFLSKTQDVIDVDPQFFCYNHNFKVLYIWTDFDKAEDSIIKKLAESNIGTITETALLPKYELPVLTLKEFIEKELTEDKLVTGYQYKNLFINALSELAEISEYDVRDNISDDCENSDIKFYLIRHDADSSYKWGHIEYAIVYDGLLCGRLTCSEKWLDTYTIELFDISTDDYKSDPVKYVKEEFLKYYTPEVEQENIISIDNSTNMLNIFTPDSYYDKEYS